MTHDQKHIINLYGDLKLLLKRQKSRNQAENAKLIEAKDTLVESQEAFELALMRGKL